MTARPRYVELWLDHAKIGCGRRRFVVLRHGRKHVRLLYPATLAAFVIGRDEFDKAKPTPVSDVEFRQVARRIERQRRQWARLGLAARAGVVRQAIALLRGGPAAATSTTETTP